LLLGLFTYVAIVVGLSLRKPPPEPPVETAAANPEPGEAVLEGVLIKSFQAGENQWVLRAARVRGREGESSTLEQVNVTFSYTAEGERSQGTVTAREGTYDAEVDEAQFRGDVVVRTADGLELRTESLRYRGERGNAVTRDPVAFRTETLRGTATGLAYNARASRLTLQADVDVTITTASEGEINVRSGQATVHERQARVLFEEAVRATRGSDVLTAERLSVFGSRDAVRGIRAIKDVDLSLGAGGLPGAEAELAGEGRRRLRAHQLDIDFREDGSLDEVVGSYGAELVLEPGSEDEPEPEDEPERRILTGKVLSFRWDEQGRLQELQGQRDTTLRIEPTRGGKPPLTLSSRRFLVQVDTATGEVRDGMFDRDVVITRGTQVGRGSEAVYEGARRTFSLRGDPVLQDPDQGSELVAQTIDFLGTGEVEAWEDVRHTIEAEAGDRGGLLEGDGQPAVFRCRSFTYSDEERRATYRGDPAVLRRGADELRAPTLRVLEDGAGRRRLEAEGGVATLFHPEPSGSEAPRDPVEGHAQTVVYEELARTLLYRGDVRLVQGQLSMSTPDQALIQLSGESRAIESVTAGEPVELVQGDRRGSGARAVYRPDLETMELEGSLVVLEGPEQRVEGRSLTFSIRDDTIRVDGRDLGRTRTIFQ
jgi:lipopolysaccharide export system protein LptA